MGEELMPIWRFKTHEEARRALNIDPNDPRLTERIRALWTFSNRLSPPPPIRRGVHKYRSIEEANAARRQWEAEHLRWLAEQRDEKE